MLLDIDDPTKVIARAPDFILEPEEFYEITGLVIPRVVFPSATVVKDETLYIQAGGGVVHDSDPEAEYMETVHKSNAIRRAAADPARFGGDGNL
jgi:predicted GH43/DUF377 family glycosyl hydrolase